MSFHSISPDYVGKYSISPQERLFDTPSPISTSESIESIVTLYSEGMYDKPYEL